MLSDWFGPLRKQQLISVPYFVLLFHENIYAFLNISEI